MSLSHSRLVSRWLMSAPPFRSSRLVTRERSRANDSNRACRTVRDTTARCAGPKVDAGFNGVSGNRSEFRRVRDAAAPRRVAILTAFTRAGVVRRGSNPASSELAPAAQTAGASPRLASAATDGLRGRRRAAVRAARSCQWRVRSRSATQCCARSRNSRAISQKISARPDARGDQEQLQEGAEAAEGQVGHAASRWPGRGQYRASSSSSARITMTGEVSR